MTSISRDDDLNLQNELRMTQVTVCSLLSQRDKLRKCSREQRPVHHRCVEKINFEDGKRIRDWKKQIRTEQNRLERELSKLKKSIYDELIRMTFAEPDEIGVSNEHFDVSDETQSPVKSVVPVTPEKPTSPKNQSPIESDVVVTPQKKTSIKKEIIRTWNQY